MAFKPIALAAAMSVAAMSALAGDGSIVIGDAYARSGAKSGAAFFTIMNHSDRDDRLIGATSDVAKRVELHTHTEDDNGVMRMREIASGIVVPAGGSHALARGGDHVMFMGLAAPLKDGTQVDVTLTFEKAGDMNLSILVDNDRKPKKHGHSHSHGHSGHGSKDGGPQTGKENQ